MTTATAPIYHVTYLTSGNNKFDNLADAEAHARKKAGGDRDGDTWYVFKAVTRAEQTNPNVELIKLD